MPRRKFVSESSQVLDSGIIAQFKNAENQDSNSEDSEDLEKSMLSIKPKVFVPFSNGNITRDSLFLLLICLAGFVLYFLYKCLDKKQ